MKKVKCATITGIEAETVEVEVNFTRGVPKIYIVGLAASEIQESRERFKSALLSTGFILPNRIVTINLSPSDLKKTGSFFDFPFALMIALFNYDEVDLKDWYVFGELGLDGVIKDTKAIFPAILSLKRTEDIKKVLVPKNSVHKLSKIQDLEIYGVETLEEAIGFFRGEVNIEPIKNGNLDLNSIIINNEKYFYTKKFKFDFKDVKGQRVALRGALISAAGFHNIIFDGSPGSGKSMIAKRLQYILPPLVQSEILEIAKFEALDGNEPQFDAIRPFRSPHHTASRGAIFGGGTKIARVGEVTKAHLGILFFDELPHFTKPILEAMREPLQDKYISISRVETKYHYPANFLFVGARNPCPCGNLMSKNSICRCSDLEVRRYQNILSEPFWDRIDIYIAMQETSLDDESSTSSEIMFNQVLQAFKKQIERGQKNLNGRLSDEEIEKYIQLDLLSLDVLRKATERFNLSLRAVNKIKKVARTIADLENSDEVIRDHILEALSFRRRF